MTKYTSYGYQKIPDSEKRRLILGHFEAIARRYDLADALLSFGLHFFWRRRAMHHLQLSPGARVLDVCAGTADFALLAARATGPGGQVVACDFLIAI